MKLSESQVREHLHIVIITSDGEREAAWNTLARRVVRFFESAAGEHSFLGVVESNRAKFLPVAHQLILNEELMDCEFALEDNISRCQKRSLGSKDHSHRANSL